MKIERDIKQYKDIETFKDYELTNNLAYEMGVRNSNVIKAIKYILSVGRSNLQTILEIIDIEEELKKDLSGINKEELIKQKHEYEDILQHNEEASKYKDDLIETLNKEYLSGFPYTNYLHLDSFLFEGEEKYSGCNLIHHLEDFKARGIIDMDRSLLNISYEDYTEEDGILQMLMTPANTAKFGVTFPTNIKHEVHKLFPSFNRPYMRIPEEVSKHININLNLHLPENELVTYIRKIKQTYEKEKELILTPIDLFDETDTSIYSVSSKLGRGSRSKTKQEIYADTFFIYDCVKNKEHIDIGNYKNIYDYINSELQYYYAKLLLIDDGIEIEKCDNKKLGQYKDMISNMDKRTIEKRYQTMDRYIEEELYKTLLF